MFRFICFALTFAYVMPVDATDVLQAENGNAVNTCTPAFQKYDVDLRRRPLAIVNEGTTGSFINCAYRAPTNSFGQEMFGVRLRNYTNTESAVTCVGVIGVEDDTVKYITKTTRVPAQSNVLVKWTYQDDNYGAGRIQTNTSLQCFLPPGVGMTELPQIFRQK